MLALFALLADVVPSMEPLAQWGGIVLQAGAFGLLTYIVMFLAPQLIKEARLERESREKATREEREVRDKMFSDTINVLQTRFEDRNKEIVSAVKDQTQILATALNSSSSRIEGAVASACKHRPV